MSERLVSDDELEAFFTEQASLCGSVNEWRDSSIRKVALDLLNARSDLEAERMDHAKTLDIAHNRLKGRDALLAACKAAIQYDKAIRFCASRPERMASFCTAQGQDLDFLYDQWVTKSREAIALAEPDENSDKGDRR